MTQIIEEIIFAHDDPYPTLRGYDMHEVRIVKHKHYNPDTRKSELDDDFTIQIMCPCCSGNGRLTGSIMCEGGGGCEHDVEVDCSTCEGDGWCDIVIEQDHMGYKFFFDDWGAHEEMTMTELVLKKYLSYMDGWDGQLDDPNQQKLFEETP